MRDMAVSSEALFEQTNAARDASAGIGIVDDPYPRYHELQAQCPMHGGVEVHSRSLRGLGHGRIVVPPRHSVNRRNGQGR